LFGSKEPIPLATFLEHSKQLIPVNYAQECKEPVLEKQAKE